MSWNYRIIRYRDGQGFGLHEVYYGADGKPKLRTTDRADFACDVDEGPAGLISSLSMALRDARELPVLDEDDFVVAEPAP